MNFKEAFKEMKSGLAVKLPSWSGYWWWDEEAQTILMYTKDGGCLDIRETQRVEYTIQNILSDDWIYADGRTERSSTSSSLQEFLTRQRMEIS